MKVCTSKSHAKALWETKGGLRPPGGEGVWVMTKKKNKKFVGSTGQNKMPQEGVGHLHGS